MATYPNLPGGYMYDLGRDGSQVTLINGSTGALIQELNAGDMDELSNWQNTNKIYTTTDHASIVCLFPQAREVTGIHAVCRRTGSLGSTAYVETSSDTTDGLDGNWIQVGTFDNPNGDISDAVFRRDRLFTVGAGAVVAVRLRSWTTYDSYFGSFMVWGNTPVDGLNPWHATLDQPLSNDTGDLDRGDILITAPPVTQQFRIKNSHPTSEAQSVVIAADATSDLGSLDEEITFSTDNTNFQQSVTLTSIAANTISPIIYMKRGTPTDLAGTVRACTIRATATAWT